MSIYSTCGQDSFGRVRLPARVCKKLVAVVVVVAVVVSVAEGARDMNGASVCARSWLT